MQPQTNIAVLINPKSSKEKVRKILDVIEEKLQKEHIAFNVFINEWPELINDFKEIWLIGGDGTVNFLLNYYLDISIPIAIFKGGTGNDVAWELYGSLSTAAQVMHLLSCNVSYVDAGFCNGKIFMNGIGIGFDGEVLRSMKTVRKIGGHMGYLFMVLKTLLTFKENNYKICFGDHVLKGKYLLVMVTNSTRTGGGFKVSPEASLADGKLNLILCEPFSILKRLFHLPVIQAGKHLQRSYITHELVDTLIIESDKMLFAQLDGELIEGKKFDIKVLPERYKFKY